MLIYRLFIYFKNQPWLYTPGQNTESLKSKLHILFYLKKDEHLLEAEGQRALIILSFYTFIILLAFSIKRMKYGIDFFFSVIVSLIFLSRYSQIKFWWKKNEEKFPIIESRTSLNSTLEAPVYLSSKSCETIYVPRLSVKEIIFQCLCALNNLRSISESVGPHRIFYSSMWLIEEVFNGGYIHLQGNLWEPSHQHEGEARKFCLQS